MKKDFSSECKFLLSQWLSFYVSISPFSLLVSFPSLLFLLIPIYYSYHRRHFGVLFFFTFCHLNILTRLYRFSRIFNIIIDMWFYGRFQQILGNVTLSLSLETFSRQVCQPSQLFHSVYFIYLLYLTVFFCTFFHLVEKRGCLVREEGYKRQSKLIVIRWSVGPGSKYGGRGNVKFKIMQILSISPEQFLRPRHRMRFFYTKSLRPALGPQTEKFLWVIPLSECEILSHRIQTSQRHI